MSPSSIFVNKSKSVHSFASGLTLMSNLKVITCLKSFFESSLLQNRQLFSIELSCLVEGRLTFPICVINDSNHRVYGMSCENKKVSKRDFSFSTNLFNERSNNSLDSNCKKTSTKVLYLTYLSFCVLLLGQISFSRLFC